MAALSFINGAPFMPAAPFFGLGWRFRGQNLALGAFGPENVSVESSLVVELFKRPRRDGNHNPTDAAGGPDDVAPRKLRLRVGSSVSSSDRPHI